MAPHILMSTICCDHSTTISFSLTILNGEWTEKKMKYNRQVYLELEFFYYWQSHCVFRRCEQIMSDIIMILERSDVFMFFFPHCAICLGFFVVHSILRKNIKIVTNNDSFVRGIKNPLSFLRRCDYHSSRMDGIMASQLHSIVRYHNRKGS